MLDSFKIVFILYRKITVHVGHNNDPVPGNNVTPDSRVGKEPRKGMSTAFEASSVIIGGPCRCDLF